MRSTVWNRFGVMLALVVLAAAACDEGVTDPLGDFDAREASQTVQTMRTAVETDDLGDAYGSLESASFLFSGMSLLRSGPLEMDVSGVTAPDLVAGDLIPSEYLGVTFVWDPSEMTYVASDRAGAPADGVRVIYYAIDPATGLPATPLNELGYVEIRDLSTSGDARLAVRLVRTSGDSGVLADYVVQLSYTVTVSSISISASAAGYLSDGTDRLNFKLTQTSDITSSAVTISRSLSLRMEGTDDVVNLQATLTADPSSESDDAETIDAVITIMDGSQTVRIDLAVADGIVDGTIYHDDRAVVLISGTVDDPTFTDVNGDPLTQEQTEALEALWDSLDWLFEFAGRVAASLVAA